ncbi:hypothetical protein CsSME_00025269 [Camellia sinensis var. sinensis]
MSSSERPSSSSSSSSPRNIDPLLKDLSEKKQSFRQNVVSLAVELKEVRSRLASQEHSFALQTLSRQACKSVYLFMCLYVYLFVSVCTLEIKSFQLFVLLCKVMFFVGPSLIL